MEDNYVRFCYKCVHSECKIDSSGTSYYWCNKLDQGLGPTITSLRGCEKYCE